MKKVLTTFKRREPQRPKTTKTSLVQLPVPEKCEEWLASLPSNTSSNAATPKQSKIPVARSRLPVASLSLPSSSNTSFNFNGLVTSTPNPASVTLPVLDLNESKHSLIYSSDENNDYQKGELSIVNDSS